MPSLKDLKNRIASVKATQKITKAMKMVAAAKLRRAQEAAEAARPYSERMAAVLSNIANAVTDADDVPVLMTGTGRDQVHLLVVCTAERGLCGGFNSQIARFARDHARKLFPRARRSRSSPSARRATTFFAANSPRSSSSARNFATSRRVGFENADQIGKRIIEMFEAGEFDVCTLFYSEFKSVISQIPTAQQLIPASVPTGVVEDAEHAGAVYEYEPDPASILSDLIPRNISVQIFRALLENVAGEMGAKMSAMDNATRNAGEMINKLTLSYNRQRQAQITKELIEIISGAEAL